MPVEESGEDVHIFYHNCDSKSVEVHGHLQCTVCGRVTASCCEGASNDEQEATLWYRGPSSIHGEGAFGSRDIPAGTRIAEIAAYKMEDWFGVGLTEVGQLVNHQIKSNCNLKLELDGKGYWLYASSDISKDEELVANYTEVPFPFRRDIDGFKEVESPEYFDGKI